MLGFESPGIVLAYLLTLAAALLCVVYGMINWNKPEVREVDREINEEIDWESRDPESMEER